MESQEQKNSSSTTAESDKLDKGPLVDQAKHAMTSVASQAKEQVAHRIDRQKDQAVEKAESVAGTIRHASDALKGFGPLGDVAERAANGIEKAVSFLDRKQVSDVVRQVEGFARREPVVFLGTAFAAGLIGGRFLRSSSHRADIDRDASRGAGWPK